MRSIIWIVLLNFTFLSVNAQSQDEKLYRVVKIDSTENNYIINLEENEIRYVVISQKSRKRRKKKRIVLGKEYRLNLVEFNLAGKFQLDKNLSIVIDDKIIWEKGDNFKLYFCDDIKGLYLKRKKCKNGN